MRRRLNLKPINFINKSVKPIFFLCFSFHLLPSLIHSALWRGRRFWKFPSEHSNTPSSVERSQFSYVYHANEPPMDIRLQIASHPSAFHTLPLSAFKPYIYKSKATKFKKHHKINERASTVC